MWMHHVLVVFCDNEQSTYPTTESASSSSLETSEVMLNRSQYEPLFEQASVCVATVATGNDFILISMQSISRWSIRLEQLISRCDLKQAYQMIERLDSYL